MDLSTGIENIPACLLSRNEGVMTASLRTGAIRRLFDWRGWGRAISAGKALRSLPTLEGDVSGHGWKHGPT